MWVLYLFSCVAALFNNILCHYDDFSNGYHYEKAFPQEVMVDVVNNFGVALLEAHNEDNNNNIALSPYGATSVLIALGEGIRGYAVQEIQEAARVPQDVSVVRVGLRDIHRHLKSYFIPKEGFLAGLTLNNEKIQLNDEYKEILRFYGFDLDSFNSPLYPDIFETSTAAILNITEDGMTTIGSPFLPTVTTVTPEKSTSGDIKTTENPIVTTRIQPKSTDSLLTVTTELATTTMMSETTSNEVTLRTTNGNVETTTQQPMITSKTTEHLTTVTTSMPPTTESATIKADTTTIKDKTTTIKAETTTIEAETTTIKTETTTVKVEVTTIKAEATTPKDEATTLKDETTTLKDEATTLKDLTTTTTGETTTQEATKATTEIPTVTVQTKTTTKDNEQTVDDLEATSTETLSTKDDASTEITGGTKENKKRNSRSIIDYIIARHYDNQLFKPTKFNNNNHYEPAENPSFLIYGTVREPNINFMSYDAVLPVAYLPLLNAVALSFPLDSKEYYLLLILPEDETGINKLIHDMARIVSLKDVITSLRYAHVRAVIPSFMLKGYVVLTPSLQKLGIQRIFEPRRTDFSLMTKEKDVYVTNIEQAVTVTIRNYVDSDNLPNYRNLQRARPVFFQADHPFLYFVMDTEIHVALMAGKIVNPLNSRIR